MERLKTALLESEELLFLRETIKKKFLEARGSIELLKFNAFLPNYNELWSTMKEALPDHATSISPKRLRKLFYDTDVQRHGTEKAVRPSFGIDFLDACYLYITNGEQDYAAYRAKSNGNKPFIAENVFKTKPWNRVLSLFRTHPWLGIRLSIYTILIFTTLFYIRFDLRVIPWLFSPQPKHHWWICEYIKEDGTITKVYNKPRSYRTKEEVVAYFTGDGRRWLERKGDCDAFFFDKKGEKRHLCYGSIEIAESYINLFGKIDTIYKEQAQISTLPDSLKIRLN